MGGLLGSVASGLQAAGVERESWAGATWTPDAIASLLGFQFCLFGMYVLTSIFLSFSDAALFNLSLLTSDMYSVLFAWHIQHLAITWMYCAAFVTTISGLVMYHLQPVVTKSSSSRSSRS